MAQGKFTLPEHCKSRGPRKTGFAGRTISSWMTSLWLSPAGKRLLTRSNRFLERKLGKELCAKLRFASGDAALRGGVLMISRLPRLCQTRRCHFNPASPKFLLFRPQRAEARRAQGLVLGRRKVAEISLDGVSRNGGPGGGLTMSASEGAALIGRTPFGDSLVPF